MKVICLLVLLSVLSSSSLASPCDRDGWTALNAADGSAYLFYLFREIPDVYFAIPGKKMSFPDGIKESPQFIIDGILYQSLLVKPTEFMKLEKGVVDLDILKKHQTYEFDYLQKTPTPLRKFVEHGPRVKGAAEGQPTFTFYLWEAADPRDQEGTRQYFLTTVSAGEVIVLSAIVRDQAADEIAMQAFETYASSFRHVLKKEDCPKAEK
jgi:hypothetical protein